MNLPRPYTGTRWSCVAFVSLLVLFVSAPPASSAQANNPNYTDDYPSVDRVKAEIQGKDSTDTIARQIGVLTYLAEQIKRIKLNRDYRGPYTPGEERLLNAYSLAAYQMYQDYNKTHTPEENKAFDMLQFNYTIDRAFREQWTKLLIGPQGQHAYTAAQNDLAATQKRHYDQQMQTYIDAQKQPAAAGSGSNATNDPTALATRRCLELGGDQLACVGKGMSAGFMDMIGFNSLGLTGLAQNTGVVLIGQYNSSGTSLSFGDGSVTIESCGHLVNDGHSYTIAKSPSALQINVQNGGHPFVLTMRPDGGLTGPGPIDVSGRIIIGYHTVTSTLYVNGVPAQCGAGLCTSTSTIMDYAPRIERCTIGSYNPPPPPPPQSASDSSGGGLLGSMMGFMSTIAPPDRPGLRMVGQYSGAGGLILNFDTNSVTLDCGKAHIKQHYTVRNAQELLVNVENNSGPFTLAVQRDNSLRGSGSTTVNGRLVSGMQGDNITFTPVSASCPVTELSAKSGSSNTPIGSAQGSSPVPASSSSGTGAIVRLSIHGGFPQQSNPLPGKTVLLMRNRFDNVLKGGGFTVPANSSPGKAMAQWIASCKSPTESCKAMLKAIGADVAGQTALDVNSNGEIIAQLPPATYFVMASAPGESGQTYLWDLPIKLQSGNSSIVLDLRGAETMRSAQ